MEDRIDIPESGANVLVKAPVRKSESENVLGYDKDRDGRIRKVSKSRSSESSLKVDANVDGVEATAHFLKDVAEAHDVLDYVDALLPEMDGYDDFAAEGESIKWREGRVIAHLRAAVPAVYLAARAYANDNQSGTVSRRYGWEKVLVAWAGGAGYGFPEETGDDAFFNDNFADDWSQAAHHALFTFVLDQHEGAEIDVADIPDRDEIFEFRRERESRHNNNSDKLLSVE